MDEGYKKCSTFLKFRHTNSTLCVACTWKTVKFPFFFTEIFSVLNLLPFFSFVTEEVEVRPGGIEEVRQ